MTNAEHLYAAALTQNNNFVYDIPLSDEVPTIPEDEVPNKAHDCGYDFDVEIGVVYTGESRLSEDEIKEIAIQTMANQFGLELRLVSAHKTFRRGFVHWIVRFKTQTYLGSQYYPVTTIH